MRSYDGACSEHCNAFIPQAIKACGILRQVFRSRYCKLLLPAFTYYVQPVLSHCKPAWNSFLKRDVARAAVERVQRSFMKLISFLECLSYEDRLRQLNALSLNNMKLYTDTVTVFK